MESYEEAWKKAVARDRDNVYVTFMEDGRNYVFSHSRVDKGWKLAEMPDLMMGHLLPQEKKSGNWQRYYEVMIPFVENGKNYLFAHSELDNRWFIAELSTRWNGYAEVRSGNWKEFYGSAAGFEEDGKSYLIALSANGNRCFISDLSADAARWNGNDERFSYSWAAFAEMFFAFSHAGRSFLCAHSRGWGGWTIMRLKRDRFHEIASKHENLSALATMPEFDPNC